MQTRGSLFLLAISCGLVCGSWHLGHAEDTPPKIDASRAREHVGKQVQVEFQVKGSKHSVKRKTYFLDSQPDFNDPANLGIQIPDEVAERLKSERQIENPATFYLEKKIVVRGEVFLMENRVYIKLKEPSQIELAKS